MSVWWVPGENYVDLFSSQPFSIHLCKEIAGVRGPSSCQSFPLHARRSVAPLGGYVATLWALHVGSEYCVRVTLAGAGSQVDGAGVAPVEEEVCNNNHEELGAETLEESEQSIIVSTRPYADFASLLGPAAILNIGILYRKDFLDCVLSQNTDYMYLLTWNQPLGTVLHHLFFHSLFAVPGMLLGEHVFALPNEKRGRFCLDLQHAVCAWRSSRKIRRLISCGRYVVEVNRDIRDSLRLAHDYHMERVESTWMKNYYIDILVSMAKSPEFGVRIMSVELLEKASGKVLAGCLGYALGSVYHDFTMFTAERATESFGTGITKVLGEALQCCGYNLWYWGSRLGYMAQFEAKYGARYICKEEFLARWAQCRELQPNCSVDEYLKSGKGMLPHIERHV
ncbi:hypothetical protein DQ04_01351020 [Trypanosoma grayi]|uniref:hypothetical protein n=1 Tax=Trypanosoma grayi TaxID=71804 RepID=UPI0004F3F970|nr:hypothetical protein DQ04_01351020 [Trypanosoma grayi]KEG12879.1 hypothetical protein DQ04_01351020 [Trypanosoma grayi]